MNSDWEHSRAKMASVTDPKGKSRPQKTLNIEMLFVIRPIETIAPYTHDS